MDGDQDHNLFFCSFLGFRDYVNQNISESLNSAVVNDAITTLNTSECIYLFIVEFCSSFV